MPTELFKNSKEFDEKRKRFKIIFISVFVLAIIAIIVGFSILIMVINGYEHSILQIIAENIEPLESME